MANQILLLVVLLGSSFLIAAIFYLIFHVKTERLFQESWKNTENEFEKFLKKYKADVAEFFCVPPKVQPNPQKTLDNPTQEGSQKVAPPSPLLKDALLTPLSIREGPVFADTLLKICSIREFTSAIYNQSHLIREKFHFLENLQAHLNQGLEGFLVQNFENIYNLKPGHFSNHSKTKQMIATTQKVFGDIVRMTNLKTLHNFKTQFQYAGDTLVDCFSSLEKMEKMIQKA